MLEAQAVSAGVNASQLLLFGENAGTRAAYNEAYSMAASRHAAQDAKSRAQHNIAALRQDKILSNNNIRMQQDQAEAMVLVQAAAAGVEGGSVDTVQYETERTAAFATQANSRRFEQEEQSYLSAIGSQSKALLTMEDREYNYFEELFVAGANAAGVMLTASDEEKAAAGVQWDEGVENVSSMANSIMGYFGG